MLGRVWGFMTFRLSRIWQVLVAMAGLALLWWGLPLALYKDVASEDVRVKAITDTRTALLAGLIGLGAIGTFWLNSRIYKITARTFELTEQGHLTERYSKAIEQLGSKGLDVRLGGIYALERIAVDSARDHPTVVEVLSAFVREHSNPARRGRSRAPAPSDHPQPTADVQAALTVLGRLPPREGVARAQLAAANLCRIDLNGANLCRALLREADLSGATLDGADLSGADLREANLSPVDVVEPGDLIGALLLRGAHLVEANLSGATLEHANLCLAVLVEANLSGADLREANLSDAYLHEANLSGANLDGANLSGAHLDWADLSGAQLDGVNLSGADLAKANLSGAFFGEANLSGADLHEANLSGAFFGMANLWDARGLSQGQLDSASGDALTWLPEGLQQPASWASDRGRAPSD